MILFVLKKWNKKSQSIFILHVIFSTHLELSILKQYRISLQPTTQTSLSAVNNTKYQICCWQFTNHGEVLSSVLGKPPKISFQSEKFIQAHILIYFFPFFPLFPAFPLIAAPPPPIYKHRGTKVVCWFERILHISPAILPWDINSMEDGDVGMRHGKHPHQSAVLPNTRGQRDFADSSDWFLEDLSMLLTHHTSSILSVFYLLRNKSNKTGNLVPLFHKILTSFDNMLRIYWHRLQLEKLISADTDKEFIFSLTHPQKIKRLLGG